ncbi:hypothetical protein M4I21_10460 [Cellulophaga sp. 20_2_10]|uniref:hypothetical protein n=1 Tax=Cellulophaga sp. 20_2_10 TaxID=2942476 RepID=UPI00201AEBF2|nr:hypothetical protein [Cellulophaga sp. 20_2_10]MCL5246231.1 hypothetical protein [Cellulophaga sp. 20_2_10]
MKKIKSLVFVLLCILLVNCKTEKHQFPTDKRYWNLEDYKSAVLHLNFGYEPDEKLPSFNDPETRIIVEKLTDPQNFKIVLDDNELGIKHRNDIAEKFFLEWKGMTDIYTATDRKDKYLYEKEMIAVWQFGLGLQLRYFKLGNDQIKESADDPNSARVQNNINSNVNTLIENYLFYIDEINNEKAFSDQGIAKLVEGIDTYFPELINLYPDANFYPLKTKAELMLKKSESENIKKSLTNIIALINSKTEKVQ